MSVPYELEFRMVEVRLIGKLSYTLIQKIIIVKSIKHDKQK